MKVVSLCSGYGGLELALRTAGVDHELAYVADPDPAASAVLAARFPGVPNLGDITHVDWRTVGRADLVTAGFPCTDVSLAGLGAGIAPGTRSGVWLEVARAIGVLRPRLVWIENVRGLLSARAHSDVEPCPWCLGDRGGDDQEPVLRALGAVLGDLSDLGYDAQWVTVSASDVGCAHQRERVFVLAHPADAESDPWRLLNGDRSAAGEHVDVPGLLIPTPAARLGRCTSITPTTAARRQARGRGVNLDDWAALLPTPTAARYGNNQSPSPGAAVRHGLDSIDRLLPTPKASDGAKGGPNQRGSAGDLTLPSAVQPGRWGRFEAAISRWAEVIGRPAPEPTEPSKSDAVRLAPQFVEWLMGLPEGWVCDVPGLSRNDQLRLLGNGVVPDQAARALDLLDLFGALT